MDYKKTLSQARKRFEQLCNDAGKEYLLNEYNLDNWTLRDFVSEAEAEANSQSEYDSPDKPLINKYKRFVNSYKDKINGIPTNEKHYSKYDLKKAAQREIEKWVTFNGRRIPIFKKDVASSTIRGIKKPTGNPELTAYGKYNGQRVKYTDSDYSTKTTMEKDLRANEIKEINI